MAEHRGVRYHLELGDCAVRNGDMVCARPGGHPLTGFDGWHITMDGRGFTGPDHAALDLRVRAGLVDGDVGVSASDWPTPPRTKHRS